MSELLSTNEAAHLLGVGPSSVKRWADEGLLPCVRTAGGHRRFERSAILEHLQRTRGQTSEDGLSPQRFLDDTEGLESIAALMSLRGRLGSWWAVANRLGEFVEQVGRAWSEGELSVIEEHIISERLARAVQACARFLPTSDSQPKCLLVLAEGEEHQLGLYFAELVLREAGWQAVWVGRKTPLDDLEEALASRPVQAIAVSASSYLCDEKEMKRQLKLLATRAEEASVPLFVGGKGAWPVAPSYGKRLDNFEDFHRELLAIAG
jgi:excisionase family DNA binding protein